MFRLQFQMSMGQMDGLKKVRAMKKDRARMLTILRERETGGSEESKMAEAAEAARHSRTRRSARWSRPRCRRPSWWK